MTRIKAAHKLRGFRKYQALTQHESQQGTRKLINTYVYEVPEKRVEEALYLGGEAIPSNNERPKEIIGDNDIR